MFWVLSPPPVVVVSPRVDERSVAVADGYWDLRLRKWGCEASSSWSLSSSSSSSGTGSKRCGCLDEPVEAAVVRSDVVGGVSDVRFDTVIDELLF